MSLLSFLSSPVNHAARRAAAMPAWAETVPAAPLYPAARKPPTPEMMCAAFYDGCDEFYSADFRAGFRYMASVLCGSRKASRPMMQMGSPSYDAFQYGVQQASDFSHSAEWKALAS